MVILNLPHLTMYNSYVKLVVITDKVKIDSLEKEKHLVHYYSRFLMIN
jgi:hypothetical protein